MYSYFSLHPPLHTSVNFLPDSSIQQVQVSYLSYIFLFSPLASRTYMKYKLSLCEVTAALYDFWFIWALLDSHRVYCLIFRSVSILSTPSCTSVLWMHMCYMWYCPNQKLIEDRSICTHSSAPAGPAELVLTLTTFVTICSWGLGKVALGKGQRLHPGSRGLLNCPRQAEEPVLLGTPLVPSSST